MSVSVFATAAAIVAAPILLGMLVGVVIVHLRKRHLAGIVALFACLALPTILALAFTLYIPILGLWDASIEGLLCGVGIVCAAHRAYADPRNLLLTATSVVVGFALLEITARIVLPHPPSYPIPPEGPQFLLANVVRTTGPDSPSFFAGELPAFLEKTVMSGVPNAGSMTERPPSAMVTREIVCAIAYGRAHSPVTDIRHELEEVFPDPFIERAGASRRVLHVGDSMVYGANAARDQVFTVNLEKLEPTVQHINAGISGMAPDDYLVVLRSWLARQKIDQAVMYLFAGNDMVGMDAPHPCSDWQPILDYAGDRALMRFPDAPHSERGIGLQWLVINSPLPYLIRVAIVAGSHAAAFVGASLEWWRWQVTRKAPETQFQHLRAILKSARDELAAKQIAFVVVVLPMSGDIGVSGGATELLSRWTREIAHEIGLPMLDAAEVIRAALARGERPIQSDRVHLTEEGHALIARWLHENLPRAQPPGPN